MAGPNYTAATTWLFDGSGTYRPELLFDYNAATPANEYITANIANPVLDFDFGHAVRLDRFSFQNRTVASLRQATSFTLTLDDSADFGSPLLTFNSGALGTGEAMQNFALTATTARYARLAITGDGWTGAKEIRFWQDWSGVLLASPAAIASSSPYSTNTRDKFVDGDTNTQYQASGVTDWYVTFDFGTSKTVSAVKYLSRAEANEASGWHSANLLFSDDSGFGSGVTTIGITRADLNRATASLYEELFTFPAVTARYVKLQATGGNNNWSGGRELRFYAPPAAPAVSSPTATAIGTTTATLGANVTSDGGATVTDRGTVWGATASPTGNAASQGSGVGVFTHARTGLTPGVQLFYRGYAVNSAGTSYSADGSFYTEPETQASSVTFENVAETTMRVRWTRGSGDGCLVLIKAVSAVSSGPADGTNTGYTADATFSAGTQVGSGNYVVYKGAGDSVDIAGLTGLTAYHVAVCEYAGTGEGPSGINYRQAGAATGNTTTAGGLTVPTLSSPTVSAIGADAATLGATVVSDGGAAVTDRGTVWGAAANPTANAASQGSGLGELAHARTGLPAGTQVHFRGYAVNSVGTNYSADSSFYTEPATPASGVGFANVTPSGLRITWARGSGTGCVVLVRAGGAVSSDVADGVAYTASAVFGSGGSQVGTGNYVVYQGDGTHVDITGLAGGATYHVAVYEYAGSGGGASGINYRQDSPARASQAVPFQPAVSIGSFADMGAGNQYGFDLAIVNSSALDKDTLSGTQSGTYAATDWKLFNNKSFTPTEQRSGGSRISAVSLLGSTTVAASGEVGHSYKWSNGATIASGTVTAATPLAAPRNNGESSHNGVGEGYTFTIAGAAGTHHARIYTGGYNVSVNVTFSLAGVASPPTGSFTTSGGSGAQGYFDVTWTAALDGDALTVTITETGDGGNWDNVNLAAISTDAVTPLTAPSVSSPAATAIAATTATLGATVTGDGGAAVTDRGTVWGPTTDPTGNRVSQGSGLGTFTHVRSGLPAGTLTHFRGYAANAAGTNYTADASFYTEPAAQASGVTFENVTETGMRIRWAAGSGAGRIVLVKAGSAVDAEPADGADTGYAAAAAFGGGTELGSGNFVVYKGGDAQADVTGLLGLTTYHVAVFEYAGAGDGASGINYEQDAPAAGSRATLTPVGARILAPGAHENVGDALRSTSLAKPMDADRDNAYGTDGYVFPLTQALGGTDFRNGAEPLSTAIASLPTYVASVTAAAGREGFGGWGYPAVDDPVQPVAASVGDIQSGIAGENNGTEVNSLVPLYTIALTGAAANLPAHGFRLGVLVNDLSLDGRPEQIRLASSGNYGLAYAVSASLAANSMYFFDVLAPSAGEALTLYVGNRAAAGKTGTKAYIGGLTFDRHLVDITPAYRDGFAWNRTNDYQYGISGAGANANNNPFTDACGNAVWRHEYVVDADGDGLIGGQPWYRATAALLKWDHSYYTGGPRWTVANDTPCTIDALGIEHAGNQAAHQPNLPLARWTSPYSGAELVTVGGTVTPEWVNNTSDMDFVVARVAAGSGSVTAVFQHTFHPGDPALSVARRRVSVDPGDQLVYGVRVHGFVLGSAASYGAIRDDLTIAAVARGTVFTLR